MTDYAVPEEIRKLRPGKGTTVKKIDGNYYVYRCKSKRMENGHWGMKSGKCIGKIVPGTGFVPNESYCYESDTTTVLEYGQYALVDALAQGIRQNLATCFPEKEATRLFVLAELWYVDGCVPLHQLEEFYKQSWLSLAYRDYACDMTPAGVRELLDAIGHNNKGTDAYGKTVMRGMEMEVPHFMNPEIEGAGEETGYAILMRVTDQIEEKIETAAEKTELDASELLLKAKLLMISLERGRWKVVNKRACELELFRTIGFTPA